MGSARAPLPGDGEIGAGGVGQQFGQQVSGLRFFEARYGFDVAVRNQQRPAPGFRMADGERPHHGGMSTPNLQGHLPPVGIVPAEPVVEEGVRVDREPPFDSLAQAGGQRLVGMRHPCVPGAAAGLRVGPAVEDGPGRLWVTKAVVSVPEDVSRFGADEEGPVLAVPVEVAQPEDLGIPRQQEVGVVLLVLLQRPECPAEAEEVLRTERLPRAQHQQPARVEPEVTEAGEVVVRGFRQ